MAFSVMAPCSLNCFLVFCYFPLLLLAHPPIKYYGECPLQYNCPKFWDIHFPFTDTNSTNCGLQIKCNDKNENLQVSLGNKWYDFMPYDMPEEPYSIIVKEDALVNLSTICRASDFHYNIPPLPPLPRTKIPFVIRRNNITLHKCSCTPPNVPDNFFNHNCSDSHSVYYSIHPEEENSYHFPNSCSNITLPIAPAIFDDPEHDPFEYLGSILITVNLSQNCMQCLDTANFCPDNNARTCEVAKEKRWLWKVIVGSVFAGAAGIILIALIIYIRRRTSWAFKYQSRNISGHSNSNGDLENSCMFFGIPVFSYKELQEATNNFAHTRELGDGGFGIVYYGKLRDGREVAVKRLYEHNYKRVQQFMTEIEILTRLRHRNLVTLYGCTSRHSRELLLVYEYIPNGTVACHLHGDAAKPGSLPWPVRMRIAVETASALAYLHASDTIHRDVKTNNILLDKHFSVKVADFGLSRLFPDDVTHVSTAPQGTPGYLDPEYHLCYQLTTKSDVYSFGVVLIELISSMLAVDITRIRDEINLANLALKKIQNCALSELVDPSLGFESDNEVRRMIASVAELAFQCLQTDKELRPSMDLVLSELERIENGTDKLEHLEEEDLHELQISNSKVHLPPSQSPENDEVGSLKNHSK